MSYSLFRNILFKMNPETAHELTIKSLKVLQSNSQFMSYFNDRLSVIDPRLQSKCFNLTFSNPVGLAAGFDKHATVFSALSSLGFGFVEVGSITPLPQSGNSKPRLFRLPEDRAIINRMGFNSYGVDKAFQNFTSIARPSIPIGINLGKNKNTPNEEAALDYQKSLECLYVFGDYFVINISSPNTEGLRNLQYNSALKPLLSAILNKRDDLCQKHNLYRPIILKIAPDLEEKQLEAIISTLLEFNIDGIIASNTTISRNNLTSIHQKEVGGLSGGPLTNRSTEMIYRIYQQTNGKIPIIGSGGIFNAEDAYEKIKAGASLIQVYTGLIYQGPSITKKINEGLLELIERDGLSCINEAIGLYHK